jgi:hypothetical protein
VIPEQQLINPEIEAGCVLPQREHSDDCHRSREPGGELPLASLCSLRWSGEEKKAQAAKTEGQGRIGLHRDEVGDYRHRRPETKYRGRKNAEADHDHQETGAACDLKISGIGLAYRP